MKYLNNATSFQKFLAIFILILLIALIFVGGFVSGMTYFSNLNPINYDSVSFSKINNLSILKPYLIQDSSRIVLDSPREGEFLNNSFVLSGTMQNFFEATFNYRVKDIKGSIITDGSVTAISDNYSNFAEFSKEITLDLDSNTELILDIFEISAKDGSEKFVYQTYFYFIP